MNQLWIFLSLTVCSWASFAQLSAQTVSAPAAGKSEIKRAHPDRIQLATGAAFAPDGSLWMVGLNANNRLFVQSSPAHALGVWSNMKLLETGADEISADGENRPKIAFGPHGWVVISYTQPLTKPYTGFIRMLRSSDGGKIFGAPFTVHQDRQEITHRFESIAFDRQGVLHTLWVDKRDMPPRGAAQKYAGAAIYRNESADGGASFGSDIKLADHSCECCRIALAPNPQGQLQATWRHVFGEQTRDHAFASLSSPNALHPAKVVRSSYDEWQINACPHHGPGLAPDFGASHAGYHTVWFGIRKVQGRDEAAMRYARLSSQGEPMLETVRTLPDQRAEHADVMAFENNVAVIWRSSQATATSLKAWISKDGGRSFQIKILGQTQGPNDHPRLAQSGSRMVVVWRLMQEAQVHEINF